MRAPMMRWGAKHRTGRGSALVSGGRGVPRSGQQAIEGVVGMKEATNSVGELAKQGSPRMTRKDQGEGAMAPSIKELILSFGFADSDATWNADAFPRRSAA